MSGNRDWNAVEFHGTRNMYPFSSVVAEVLKASPSVGMRSTFRVLDLGCGGGSHLKFLAEQGYSYAGIDGNIEATHRARELLEHAGHSTDSVLVGDFLNMPFDSNSFDLIIDRGSLTCNLLADLKLCAVEVARVLRPGGQLLTWHLDEAIAPLLGGRPLGGKGDFADFPGRLSGAKFLHLSSPGQLVEVFKELTPRSIRREITTEEWDSTTSGLVDGWLFMRAEKPTESR